MRQGIDWFLKIYGNGKSECCVGSGHVVKTCTDVKGIVEEQMQKDNETEAVQLQCLLVEKGYMLSLSVIL